MSEPLPLVYLKDFADLRMGETIIAVDCTGDGLPVYSADTSDAPWNFSSRCRVANRRGCIVIGARGSIGHPRLPPYDEFAATQTTIVIDPNRSELEPRFLLYALRLVDLKSVSAQQAVPMLTIGDLRKVQIPKPSQSAQRRIAEILGTVDEVIEQTEALIAKQQQVKAGLMHDLFTRGLSFEASAEGAVTWKLRPPPAEAPHLYQDSPLGPIPKEWTAEAVESKIQVIDAQPDHRTPPAVLTGYPYIGIGDVSPTGEIMFEAARKVSADAFNKQFRSFDIHPGAFIFGKIGSLGFPTRIPHERNFAISANVVLFTGTIREHIDFVFWLCNSQWISRSMADATNTTSQPALGIQKIRKFRIPWPTSSDEREMISSRMESALTTIQSLERSLAKLRQQKQGLMHDLLTARVPVPA